LWINVGNHGVKRRGALASSRDRGCTLVTFISVAYSNKLQHNFLESLTAFKRKQNSVFGWK
jgi:hypothetical protein